MVIVFSLFGRPRELQWCLRSLLENTGVERFTVHFDINESRNPVNTEVIRHVEWFMKNSGLQCSYREHPDGLGADYNVYRTLKEFSEKVLYFAGDVLLDKECLTNYLRLNERFPDFPITLYHQLAHPIHYEKEFAILRSTTVESLLFNPSLYFDYCLFRNRFVLTKVSTIDWLLNWVFYRRKIPIISAHFSYVQHLGFSSGMTSSRWPPMYAYDFVDQPRFFSVLRDLGYDPNTCKMVRNKDRFPIFYSPLPS